MCAELRISKITIESTLKQVEGQLKDNKELSSNVVSLFKMLVLIIKVLVSRSSKKKGQKMKKHQQKSCWEQLKSAQNLRNW